MSQDNPFKNLFPNNDFSNFIANYQNILDIQKKNFETLTKAQQHTSESVMEIAQRQGEILSVMAQKNSEMLSNGNTEDAFKMDADVIQKSYEEALANAKEISDMVKKANIETTSILRKRMSDGMKEARSATMSKKPRPTPWNRRPNSWAARWPSKA